MISMIFVPFIFLKTTLSHVSVPAFGKFHQIFPNKTTFEQEKNP